MNTCIMSGFEPLKTQRPILEKEKVCPVLMGKKLCCLLEGFFRSGVVYVGAVTLTERISCQGWTSVWGSEQDCMKLVEGCRGCG